MGKNHRLFKRLQKSQTLLLASRTTKTDEGFTPPSQRAQAWEELRDICGKDIDFSPRRRSEYSTDASNYRIVPAAVIFPRSSEHVSQIVRIASRAGISITARGAGTSCAGNAVGEGIVLDFSRHMNRILHIDPTQRLAYVECGVVLSDLQKEAKKYGLRFGPDPSTQNRATVGGMVGNNACGPHALAWGRTADNVYGMEIVHADGTRACVGQMGLWSNAEVKTIEDYPALLALIAGHRSTIRTESGSFKRKVSGYGLEHLLEENGHNLPAFLVGSEGTLVLAPVICVRLVPLPEKPTLVILGYEDMPTAARDVPSLLPAHPLAIEGIDARLVDVVRKAHGNVPQLPHGNGWLFIEVSGEDPAHAQDICKRAHTPYQHICPPGEEAERLWRIRADGAGLGGRTPEGNQAWPGWEDSAVEPEKLGDYLTALEKLMVRYSIDGLMYGHFGDGCVHVRLDFPFDISPQSAGVKIYREFMEEAATLVASFGGSLSGEHGDGRARSELLPRMFSSEMISLFQEVKNIFDPHNIFNPGVLVHPAKIDENLRRPDANEVRYDGGFHFHEDKGNLTNAFHRCTGVGNCRADRFDQGFFMCPSYAATKDEKDVTRARSRILQELARGEIVTGWDSPLLKESLDLCLACKACSRDCPTGVDIARAKSEMLFRAYRGKIRPMSHYVLGNLPALSRLVAALPGAGAFANKMMSVRFVRQTALKRAGLDPTRSLPSFAHRPLSRLAQWRAATQPSSPERALAGSRPVVLWADSFSQSLDSRGAIATAQLLKKLGYSVIIPKKNTCCGLTAITTGQLTKAKKELQLLLSQLAPFAASGIPIVGVEPSCTAVLKSDLLDLLPEDPRSALVARSTYTLASLLSAPSPIGLREEQRALLPDLSDVEVVAQPHCHHYSVMGWAEDEKLLTSLGARVHKISGCCGLAGSFGMEKGHAEISQAIAQQHLVPMLDSYPQAIFLADGFSCRTQAAFFASRQGIHLASLLNGKW